MYVMQDTTIQQHVMQLLHCVNISGIQTPYPGYYMDMTNNHYRLL